MTDDDRKTLENCHQRYLNREYHPEALHLFAKNAAVDEHNRRMLDTICRDIRTCYEVDHRGKDIAIDKNKQNGLSSKVLYLAKNARVMITKNICVNDGLANGVMGRVVDFLENESKTISRVIIQCDLPTVGRLHRVHCPRCNGKETVCVGRESDVNDQQDGDLKFRKTTKQFPLRLSWAVTIHKAQGITVDQVVMSTKDLFGTGMGYTGFSRVPTQQGLFLSDFHAEKIYCNERVDQVLRDMKPLKEKPMVFRNSSKILNMLCHNIEGLKNNFHALRNHHLTNKADLLCLTETWLHEDNLNCEQLKIEGFTLLSKTRFDSFELNHPLKSKKGGGVAIYVKENLHTKRIAVSKQLNLEYLPIEIELGENNIIIIICYRSPQQTKKEFVTDLTKVLEKMNMERKILLVGDFNEDSLSNDTKPIEVKIQSLGFKNLFKDESTTKNLTSLDCVYSNFAFENEAYKDIISTYYSYHDELILVVNMESKTHELNQESVVTFDNQMVIDSCSPSSSSAFSEREKNEKRRRSSRDSNRKRKSNNTNILPSTTDHQSACLEERQMLFLSNVNKKVKKNDMINSVHLFDPNEQLNRIGFKIVNMIGDGNCFFRVISHQIIGHPYSHMKIRLEAVSYIQSNRDKFEEFLVDVENPTVDHYLQRMSKDGTYVDNLAIMATAIIIEKNLIIHEKEKTPICIPGSDLIDDQIHLWYTNDPLFPHYDSVTCINDDAAFLEGEHLVFR